MKEKVKLFIVKLLKEPVMEDPACLLRVGPLQNL